MLLNVLSELEKSFLSSLASTDPKLPASEWDLLIPQAVITLNIFRNSRVNPKLSFHTYLHGNIDFNATPLAPSEEKLIIH